MRSFGMARLLVAALAAAMLASFTVTQVSAATTTAQKLRVVTFNTDFRGAPYFKRAWDVIRPNADIVFVQEAKNVVLRNAVGSRWAVRQDTSTDATQNSAVLIRKSIANQIGSLRLVKGVGRQPYPCSILTRYIAKVPLQLSNGRRIRVASLHMPPKRCQTGPGGPYATMADNVVEFVKRTDRLTVLGGDWNKIVDDDPNRIGARTGLKPRGPNSGLRIDGFYVSRPITTCCLRKLERIGDNDHRPVVMSIWAPAP